MVAIGEHGVDAHTGREGDRPKANLRLHERRGVELMNGEALGGEISRRRLAEHIHVAFARGQRERACALDAGTHAAHVGADGQPDSPLEPPPGDRAHAVAPAVHAEMGGRVAERLRGQIVVEAKERGGVDGRVGGGERIAQRRAVERLLFAVAPHL